MLLTTSPGLRPTSGPTSPRSQPPTAYRPPLVHLNNTRNQPGANAYPFFEPFPEPKLKLMMTQLTSSLR